MPFIIEVEQENDGRWLAEVADLPGALSYGLTREEAVERVQALSLRVVADRLDHGEAIPKSWRGLIEADRSYPISSPDRAFSAAAALLRALEEDRG